MVGHACTSTAASIAALPAIVTPVQKAIHLIELEMSAEITDSKQFICTTIHLLTASFSNHHSRVYCCAFSTPIRIYRVHEAGDTTVKESYSHHYYIREVSMECLRLPAGQNVQVVALTKLNVEKIQTL